MLFPHVDYYLLQQITVILFKSDAKTRIYTNLIRNITTRYVMLLHAHLELRFCTRNFQVLILVYVMLYKLCFIPYLLRLYCMFTYCINPYCVFGMFGLTDRWTGPITTYSTFFSKIADKTSTEFVVFPDHTHLLFLYTPFLLPR